MQIAVRGRSKRMAKSKLVVANEVEEEENEEEDDREEEGKDRISNLPDPILTCILTSVTIKHAAKTSILSKRWRNLWASIPHLDLDHTVIREDPQEPRLVCSYPETERRKWLEIVYQILAMREDPLRSCVLLNAFLDRYSLHINNFIFFLSKLRIQKLHLLNMGPQLFSFSFPSNLFFCISLKALMIQGCQLLQIPPHFSGFPHLKLLTLDKVLSNNCTIELFISSCPCLEDLNLIELAGVTQIRVSAPSLKNFVNNASEPMSILFHSHRVPCLETADFLFPYFSFSTGNIAQASDANKLISLFKEMGKLKSLSLCCIQTVAKGNIVDYPLATYRLHNLKKLSLELDFFDSAVLPFLCVLLRYFPRVQEFVLKCDSDFKPMRAYDQHDYWDKQEPFECVSETLEMIQISCVNLNCEYVTGFVQFLLMSAGALKRMSITYYKVQGKQPQVLKELHLLQKASPHAQLVLMPAEKIKYRYWS